MNSVAARVLVGLIGAAIVGRLVEFALGSERGARAAARSGFRDLTTPQGIGLASRYARAAFTVVVGAKAMLDEADAATEHLAGMSPWPGRFERLAALLFVVASLAETFSDFAGERHERLNASGKAAR